MKGADVEMSQVEELKLISDDSKAENVNVSEFRLLSKEELNIINMKEPIWKRIRIAILIIFWIVWIALLVAAILLIVFTPKCPPKPELPFYKKKIGYWVDPFAFKDSDGDGVGDLPGLVDKLDYIKNELGAGYVILDPISQGQYSGDSPYLGSISKFDQLDKALGDEASVKSFFVKTRRLGLDVVLAMDFNSVHISNKKFTTSDLLMQNRFQSAKSRLGGSVRSAVNSQMYSVYGDKFKLADLDLTKNNTMEKLDSILSYWLKSGAAGVMLKDVAYYSEDPRASGKQLPISSPNNWFSEDQQNLVFNDNTIKTLARMKQSIDDISASLGKERFMFVDAGDTGYSLVNAEDPTNKFLSSADMIVGYHFLHNRGIKGNVNDSKLLKSTFQNYLQSTNDESRKSTFLLTKRTATSQTESLSNLMHSLLLPGAPILRYGTEFGHVKPNKFNSVKGVYPGVKKTRLMESPESSDFDLIDHVPMPWDTDGSTFSSKNAEAYKTFLKNSGATATHEYVTTYNIEDMEYQLVKKLSKLREDTPSLLYGSMRPYESEQLNGENASAFIRSAEGYPSVLVVIIRDFKKPGVILELKKFCTKFKILTTYPSKLSSGDPKEVIESSAMYFKSAADGISMYILQCDSAQSNYVEEKKE